ncbi:MAG: type II toxin-antitoxin system VapC family toxin [candidate division KSB1 bacterium]|nr:type II toxin-antitoxin system VapC family toxin [candidate division KSB1 bacterium]
MKFLLDTQAFLWFITDDLKLSSFARSLIEDQDSDRLISLASLWEIAIKTSLGKLELKKPFEDLLPHELELNEIDVLEIKIAHLAQVASLPFHHRDPFDRLLIAQRLVEKLPVVTMDTKFDAYNIQRLW